MELRHLEYFLAVAEELNFTRAAARLHMVQSGVSAAIRALERELGTPLFDRTSRQVSLTEAGRALLPEARATVAAAQAARDAVDQVRGGLRGTLSIGTMTSIGLLDLPALSERFHALHPGVTLRLRAEPSGSAGLAGSLLDGDLDLAFLSLPGPAPTGLRLRPLASVPLVALLRDDHPFADREEVALSDLAGSPFIDSPVGYGNRTLVDQEMADSGLERQVVIEVADGSTAAAYVCHGLGVAVLPEVAVHSDDPRLRVLPLAGRPLIWVFSCATSSTRRPSAALRAFLPMVDRHLAPRYVLTTS